MSATDIVETAVLKLVFTAVAWDDIAQNDGSSPAASFWISLHTTDPGETGDQTVGETAYGDYERQEVLRDGTGWTVSNDTVENLTAIAFPPCASAPGDPIQYLGIGLDETGAGTLMFVLPLADAITMEVATQPYFDVGEVIVTCD